MSDYTKQEDVERVWQEMAGYVKKTDIIKLAKCGWNDGDCTACDFATEGNSWCEGQVYVVNVLAIPSADVVPVKRGKWIDHIEEDYIGNGEYGYIVLPKCSVCGSLNSKKCHFCPNCGAKMEVDE